MNQSVAPRVASWALKHFGCSPKNDSLLGDLVEQHQQGRSRVWFWHQVMVAVAAGLFGEIREHKLRTFRALVIGWSVPTLYSLVIHPYIVELLWRIEPWVVVQHPAFYHSLYRNIEKFFWGEFISGFLAELLVGTCILGLISGWLISRVNRVNPRAMVMAYAASILIYGIAILTYLLAAKGITWIIPSILLFSNLALLLNVVSIFIGGGLFRDSKRNVHTPVTSA